MEQTKVCKKCNTEKPLEDFNQQATSKDGRQGYCKTCKKIINKERYESDEFNKTEYIERQKIWAKNHPEQFKKNLEKYRNKD